MWITCVVVASYAAPSAAQLLGGRVSDERDDRPISGVLVRLLVDGDPVAISISDSTGGYRLEAPNPGTYHVEAVRLGYRDFETPLLELSNEVGVYEADLLLQPAPIELPGFTVETERLTEREVNRRLRLLAGVAPASLRVRPILSDQLIDHA
ncbi:MAG: carboxypeptidase-like regulatory domain-containing protein, partial [Gemmatimonadota bacterium]